MYLCIIFYKASFFIIKMSLFIEYKNYIKTISVSIEKEISLFFIIFAFLIFRDRFTYCTRYIFYSVF